MNEPVMFEDLELNDENHGGHPAQDERFHTRVAEATRDVAHALWAARVKPGVSTGLMK